MFKINFLSLKRETTDSKLYSQYLEISSPEITFLLLFYRHLQVIFKEQFFSVVKTL